MWNKFVLLSFFAFGCWLRYLDGAIGYIGHSIWYAMALAWIILNALGIVVAIMRPKAAFYQISEETKCRWIAYYIVCTLSYLYCHEEFICLSFLLTAGVFMLLVLVAQPEKT